jgi:hypothetical protein
MCTCVASTEPFATALYADVHHVKGYACASSRTWTSALAKKQDGVEFNHPKEHIAAYLIELPAADSEAQSHS